MIELIDVNKSFAQKHVLKDISLVFEPGKTNLIIGQSGSGKTVLLKSTIGLFTIDSGQILYNNRDFSKMKTNQQKEIRKEIGMVFQGGALFDYLTVEENIKFPLDMFSDMSAKEKKIRTEFCIRRVNLDKANRLYPAEISGGMQKRVAIARAISLNPKYLFCDEPNSGLDPKTSIVIDQLISEITKEFNITTVINTHDMNSVVEIGDNIFYIYTGKLWWKGHKDEIFKSNVPEVDDFVFASELMKKVKTAD